MKLVKNKQYDKKERKFFKKRPELIDKYGEVLYLLSNDIKNPKLRLHKIFTKPPVFSVSLTSSYRIIIDILILEDKIFLIDIGNHDDVY